MELAKEVAELEADETDRPEMLSVAAMMQSIRAARERVSYKDAEGV